MICSIERGGVHHVVTVTVIAF